MVGISSSRATKIAPKSPVVKGGVKYAIKESCEPTLNTVFPTRNISEDDKREVVDLICRSLDLVVEQTLDNEVDPVKAGIWIMQGGVTVRNLTGAQQDLCQKALVDFAVNGAGYLMEGLGTASDVVEYTEISELLEPAGGGLAGGATALSLHAADLY